MILPAITIEVETDEAIMAQAMEAEAEALADDSYIHTHDDDCEVNGYLICTLEENTGEDHDHDHEEEASEQQEEVAVTEEEPSEQQEEISEKSEENSENQEETSEKEGETSEKAEVISEKEEETSEKTEETSEKKEETSEKTEETSEKTEETSEKTEETSEKKEETSEKKEETSEKTEETSEKTEETSEKKEETSEKKEETSEKTEETSEKKEETSEKKEETSEKKEETSEKTEETSEKKEETSEKTEETSEKKEETSEKTEETSEKKEETSEKSEGTSEKKEESTDGKKDDQEKTVEEQLEDLAAQEKELREQLDGVEKDSAKAQEIQDKLDSLETQRRELTGESPEKSAAEVSLDGLTAEEEALRKELEELSEDDPRVQAIQDRLAVLDAQRQELEGKTQPQQSEKSEFEQQLEALAVREDELRKLLNDLQEDDPKAKDIQERLAAIEVQRQELEEQKEAEAKRTQEQLEAEAIQRKLEEDTQFLLSFLPEEDAPLRQEGMPNGRPLLNASAPGANTGTLAERWEAQSLLGSAMPSGKVMFTMDLFPYLASHDLFKIVITDDYHLQNVGSEPDPELAYSDGQYWWSFEAETTTMGFLQTMVPYYMVPKNGFTLQYKIGEDSSGRPIFEDLTTYAANWVELPKQDDPSQGSGVYMAVRESEDYYWFYFHGGMSISTVRTSSRAVARRVTRGPDISKTGVWDETKLAFRWTLEVDLPGVQNSYGQSYFLQDLTIPGGSTYLGYDGFLNNISMEPGDPTTFDNLTVKYEIFDQDGNKVEEKNVRYLAAAAETLKDSDPTNDERVAWYLEDNGKLWLMTYGEHASEHIYECHMKNPVKDDSRYSGWCACWEELDNTHVTLSYCDFYGEQYHETAYSYENNATLTLELGRVSNPKVQGSYKIEETKMGYVPGEDVLKKKFDANDKTFTITFNRAGNDLDIVALPGFAPGVVQIYDDLYQNIYLDASTFSVTRLTKAELEAGESGTLLSPSEYDLVTVMDSAGNGIIHFDVTIHPPLGSYVYQVHYRVTQIDTSKAVIGNLASVAGSNMTSVFSGNYKDGSSASEADGYQFELILPKYYEGGANPEEGATFGLYDAKTDALIAQSYTMGGMRVVEIDFSGILLPGRVDPYMTGNSVDNVVFDGLTPLSFNKVYYIKEVNAPIGYETDTTTRIYFYISHYALGGEPADLSDYSEVTVHAVDAWEVKSIGGVPTNYAEFTFDSMTNMYNMYTLPETGGFDLPFVYFAGVILFVIPIFVYSRRRRKTG